MSATALINSLQGIRRKVKLLSVVMGGGIAVAAGVGLLLAVILLDYLLDLPAIPRLLILLAAAIGLGYVLTHWIIRPLVGRLTLRDVAGRLERSFPQFNDRL